MKDLIVTKKTLLGTVAKWAVQQSPYESGPDNLSLVLQEVARRFKLYPEVKCLAEMHYVELPPSRAALHPFIHALLDMPHVKEWNERKNGRKGHGIVTAFGPTPDPDDDFIDIDALVQNIASSLLARPEARRSS